MSTEATLLAIGPFNPAIADHLDAPAYTYDRVARGATVISEIMITTTADMTREAAKLLKINCDDASTHHDVDVSDIALMGLEQVCARCGLSDAVEGLRVLRDAGFRFFFRLP